MILRIIFTTLLALILIFGFVLILYSPVKRYCQSKYARRLNGQRIYKMAIDNDYLVVHNFQFMLSRDAVSKFDHLLFGDKFFYCIADKVWNGGITGSVEDDTWYYYPKNRKQTFTKIKNPLKINHIRTEKFSLISGLDMQDLVSIVLVNDDCIIDDIKTNSTHDYIIHVSELKKLINEIENRNIGTIDPDMIESVVNQIFNMNINKKKNSLIKK